MKIIHSLYISILTLVFVGCQNAEKKPLETDKQISENELVLNTAQLKNTHVRIGKVGQQNMGNKLTLNGSIDVPPQNLVGISFPLGGYLKSTHLLPGTHVSKGEVIALVEDQQFIELQKAYLVSKAQLNYLKNEATRQQNLSKEEAASQKDAQMASVQWQSEAINFKSLSEKLQMLGVDIQKLTTDNISKTIALRSPINGFVTKVNAIIGRYFNPSEELFELVNPNDIHLNLKVYQQDLNKVKMGQKVWCYQPSNPEKKYEAQIILISRNVNENNVVDLHCHFHDYDKSLIPGLFMNAEVVLGERQTNVIPDDAIVNFENQDYIFRAKDAHHFVLQKVDLGKSENGFTAITELDTTANYVLNDAYTLLLELKKSDEE